MPVCSKSVKFCQNPLSFHGFSKSGTFLRLFSEKCIKTEKHASLFEKLSVLAKLMIFHAFSGNEHFLQAFPENLIKTLKHASLFEKCQGLAKSTIFHGFSQNEALFAFLS